MRERKDDAEDDYASISAAVAALSAGVSGAVILDVEELTYSSGSVLIGAITGTSETNTITFRDEVPEARGRCFRPMPPPLWI